MEGNSQEEREECLASLGTGGTRGTRGGGGALRGPGRSEATSVAVRKIPAPGRGGRCYVARHVATNWSDSQRWKPVKSHSCVLPV